MTPAVKAIVYTTVAVFLVTFVARAFFGSMVFFDVFGLTPESVFERLYLWQIATYLFLHDVQGFTHILFNMLALWMFGVDLERRWGSRGFVKYYAITGVGAGVVTALVSLLPFAATRDIYEVTTVGASGAIYGLLMAWALLFPTRQILFMFMFPLSARVAAFLMGGMAFMGAAGGVNGSVAEATHLAGFVIGWLYLKGFSRLRLDFSYWVARWRMERVRRKFNVHKGGKDGWGNTIH
jgi:membrane associated rhomboid family serine protease